jgi:GNAT superfamily N-acetyltransferase
MSTFEIVALDPFDAPMFDAWHAAYFVAETHGREGTAAPWQLEELRVLMQQPSGRNWSAGWCGLVAGEVVTAGWLQTPLLDNLERASLSVHTVPDARRRGHGTAMLEHLEQVALDRGRMLIGAESSWGYEAGADGVGEPGPEFLRRTGYDLALSDVQRVATLPVPEEVLGRLAAEAAPHHAAYSLRSWSGRIPDELVLGWAELTASIATEAPTGGLELEPEVADVAMVREQEDVVARQGRAKYNTVALDAEGAVVAYTDLATTIHEQGRAYQWGTLVRRAHRGHRLGLAVKVANLRLLQRERPDITRLVTYNAEVNEHMIGVNEQLGFVPVARLGEYLKRLA